jgi:hypothetical protein
MYVPFQTVHMMTPDQDGLSLPLALGPFLFRGQGSQEHTPLKPRAIWHCLMPSASCVVSARPGHSRLTADI